MQSHIPLVRDDTLILASNDEKHVPPSIQVDSQQWFYWLEANSRFTFIIPGAQGEHVIFHKERRSRGWYWYCYYRRQGRVQRAYVGKSLTVTLAKLLVIAEKLLATNTSQAISSYEGEASARDDVFALTPANTLLLAKLTVPPLRFSLLVFSHSFNLLQQANRYALTVISAPVGFGKTTFLAQWVAMMRPSLAWLSLDEGDNDRERFWTYLITALERIMPGLAAKTRSFVHPLTQQSISLLLSLVLNTLYMRREPLFLVIDDYHVIADENQVIHDSLSYLLDHLPPQVHLIISSRKALPLPLARLRARGQLNEVHTSDLRLTHDEIGLFLSCMGVSLAVDELIALDKQIEGWISGWQLVALSLQRCHDIAEWVASFNGRNRYIEDFLTEAVLNRLTPGMLDFLLQTSILDRLTAPFCNALTHTTNSQETLEYLERANLFIEPLDEQRQWYRYHPLFAGALRSRFVQSQPERVKHLYQRASEWCLQEGMFWEAVEYALQVGDFECFAASVDGALEFFFKHGTIATLSRWLKLLPESVIEHWPRLYVVKAQLSYLDGQQEHLDGTASRQEDRMQMLFLDEQNLNHYEILAKHAIMAAMQGNLKQSLALCLQALAELPLNHPFRDIFLLDLGRVYQMNGDLEKSSEIFEALLLHNEDSQNYYTRYMSVTWLTITRLIQGRLNEIIQISRNSSYTDMEDILAGTYLTLGIALYERNELTEAEEELQRCITLNMSRLAVATAYSTLALIREDQNDHVSARQLMNQAMKELPEKSHWATAIIHANQMRLWMLQGNLDTVAQSLREQPPIDSHVYPGFIFAMLMEQKTILCARLAFLKKQPQESLTMLMPQLESARQAGRVLSVVENLALQSLANAALGNDDTAYMNLCQALELAQTEKYVHKFLQYGQPMRQLLIQWQSRFPHALTSFGQSLLAAFTDDVAQVTGHMSFLARQPVAAAQHLVEPLSAREFEILQLLAQGASNRELAKRMVIALGTVKRHLSNIFLKLGVQSRTQAIARAVELQLVNLASHNV